MAKDESNDELILRLIAERDAYLNEHPELKPFQREIDKTLNQVGPDPIDRSVKLFDMISESLNEELKPELVRLKNLVDTAIVSTDNIPRRKVE